MKPLLSGIFLVILAIAYYKLAVELGLRMTGGAPKGWGRVSEPSVTIEMPRRYGFAFAWYTLRATVYAYLIGYKTVKIIRDAPPPEVRR